MTDLVRNNYEFSLPNFKFTFRNHNELTMNYETNFLTMRLQIELPNPNNQNCFIMQLCPFTLRNNFLTISFHSSLKLTKSCIQLSFSQGEIKIHLNKIIPIIKPVYGIIRQILIIIRNS
jgi:hypothetical protein